MDQHPEPTAAAPMDGLVERGPALDARDPIFREHPHQRLDDLRTREPVHLDRELDRVALTRGEDVAAALADRTLSTDPFKARPTAYGRRGFTEDDRGNLSMFFLDDPDHARLRGLVSKAFTARAVEAMRPRVEAIAAALLDAINPDQPFDLIASFAAPLPTLVIAAMLGIDDAQLNQFKQWSDDLLILFSPERSDDDQRRLLAAREGFNACFEAEIAKRHVQPRADLISALVAAEAQGDKLTRAEIVNTLRLLLAAGNVTTTDLIGNGTVALLRHPDELAKLRAEPALWPAALEEVLRHDPPITALGRQALDGRRIGRCPVEAGQTITAMLLAANHDPALHTDPHRFDIGRQRQKHHSFGGGAHFCLGAPLARLEGQVGLAAMFDRFPRLQMVGDRVPRRKAHPGFSGYEAVWLRAR